MNMLYEALKCASVGLRVLPLYEVMDDLRCACGKPDCKQPGKHPRLGEWQDKASTDEAMIREWWRRAPDAGIGMATGRASGVWVLDLDGEEAIAWYAQKGREHGRTPTRGVQTGRGRHLYWQYPEGVEIRNRQKVDGQKVDVRGEGGFVILPPTRHHSGRYYEWRDQVPYQQEPAMPPEWLVELVKHVPPPPVVRVIPPPSVTPRELRKVFNAALDADPDLRRRLGERVGGVYRAASRPYVDDIVCPSCGRREVWFYLDGGPAVCHHRNSCKWAGPLTRLGDSHGR